MKMTKMIPSIWGKLRGFALLMCFGMALDVVAWTDPWAPAFKSESVEMEELSEETLKAFMSLLENELIEYNTYSKYCKGTMLDLNNDGIDDYVLSSLGWEMASIPMDMIRILSFLVAKMDAWRPLCQVMARVFQIS